MIHLKTLAIALAVVCSSATSLTAIEFRAGQEVTVGAGEVVADDLYVSGETVVVDGTIEGDLVAVGRHLVLNGTVTGDLIAAGQGVVVNGAVGDDVRIAGMALRVGESAAVADDLIAAGFSLEAARGSVIGGSVLVSGFQALLGGDVGERVQGELVGLRIDGLVQGGGEVTVEKAGAAPPFAQFLPTPVPMPAVPAGLSFGPDARLESVLVYTSPSEVETGADLASRLQHVTPAAPEPTSAEGAAWRGTVGKWVAILVVGLLTLVIAPTWLAARSDYLRVRALAAAGWGLAGVVAIPVLLLVVTCALLMAAIILGLVRLGPLVPPVLFAGLLGEGAVIVGLWWGLAFLAPVIAAFWLGGLALRRRERVPNRFLQLLAGWLALAVLALVPFLGALLAFVVALLGVGTLVAWLIGAMRRRRAPSAA